MADALSRSPQENSSTCVDTVSLAKEEDIDAHICYTYTKLPQETDDGLARGMVE